MTKFKVLLQTRNGNRTWSRDFCKTITWIGLKMKDNMTRTKGKLWFYFILISKWLSDLNLKKICFIFMSKIKSNQKIYLSDQLELIEQWFLRTLRFFVFASRFVLIIFIVLKSSIHFLNLFRTQTSLGPPTIQYLPTAFNCQSYHGYRAFS